MAFKYFKTFQELSIFFFFGMIEDFKCVMIFQFKLCNFTVLLI